MAAVRSRIAAACASAGRDPSSVTLIAVTKTYPVSDVRHLLSLGVTDFGENRDQEAAPKAAEVPEGTWHFIGQLQRNKARSVVTYASMVHSVDSPELAKALGERRQGTPLEVLIQVSLDDDPQRGGVPPGELTKVADAVLAMDSLRLRGLMAVAPLNDDPGVAFARLERYSRMFQLDHPDATVLSAGMSEDLVEAIACGATHVRIGSALLGKRPALR
ncbi:YggS family pyridoxal phosphate enzyme [Rhizocola hellebori]|uniref:Pyridoxal phosphate homeostasis protein n=1 Tax=Rhizocola hellebori TaxID=1392758 RepID=A0A8J3VG54_9ACTN|nr:YggS family pyridoxal phosphate enzyme [Rhizocola hellebori]